MDFTKLQIISCVLTPLLPDSPLLWVRIEYCPANSLRFKHFDPAFVNPILPAIEKCRILYFTFLKPFKFIISKKPIEHAIQLYSRFFLVIYHVGAFLLTSLSLITVSDSYNRIFVTSTCTLDSRRTSVTGWTTSSKKASTKHQWWGQNKQTTNFSPT